MSRVKCCEGYEGRRVAAASEAGVLTITGGGEDSVTLVGASYQGQTELSGSGNAYDVYSLGGRAARIDAAITVIA